MRYINNKDDGVKYLGTVVGVRDMPYAVVLEQGGGGLKKKYKVISMSFQKLHDIAKKYNGAVSIL